MSSYVSPQFKYIMFYIFICILHHLQVYCKVTISSPVASWLDSSVGRALQRYRRGHGFESRSGLNFFQALISQLLFEIVSKTAMIIHVFISSDFAKRRKKKSLSILTLLLFCLILSTKLNHFCQIS